MQSYNGNYAPYCRTTYHPTTLLSSIFYIELVECKRSLNLFWVSNATQNVWYKTYIKATVFSEVGTNLSNCFSSLFPAPARYCAERQHERSWAGVPSWPGLCGPDANHIPRAAQPSQLAGEQLSCWILHSTCRFISRFHPPLLACIVCPRGLPTVSLLYFRYVWKTI